PQAKLHSLSLHDALPISWRLWVEAHSPSSANGYSASRDSGRSSSALAATSAATQDAAEPPRPEPSAMPLSSSTAKPWWRPSTSRSEEHTSELQSRENLVC